MVEVSGFIIHCSDISNCVLDYENYIGWSIALIQEFDDQFEMENQLCIAATQMFKYTNELNFYTGQKFFVG